MPMSAKSRVFKEKTKSLQRLAEMLATAFDEIGEQIRKDLLVAYRKHAKDRFVYFMKESKTRSGQIQVSDGMGRRSFQDWHEYVHVAQKASEHSRYFSLQTWEEIRAIAPNLSVDYKAAERDANDAYEHARDSFIHKNLQKLREVLGSRDDLKNAVLKFEFRGGVFEGNVQVYLDGAYFRGEVGIKYVVRTIPRITPYFQYPLVFVEAEVGGKLYKRPSEEELRMLLGATKSREQERAEFDAAAGFCQKSGQRVPDALWRPVASRMSPYVGCPGCGSTVSASRGIFRKHRTPAAERSDAAKKLGTAGYCQMSGQPAPFPLIEKFVRSYKAYGGRGEEIHYSFNLFDDAGKYRKILCESCGQQVVIGDERSALSPDKVKAIYRKHKLPSAGGGA